jgi:hypothetical protein
MRLLLIAATLGTLGFLYWSAEHPVDAGPGVLAPMPPLQTASAGEPVFEREGFSIKPLARFEGTARVLSRTNYRFGTEAELSPTDLALGWGRMSDSAVIEQLEIDQGGRWYHYTWHAAEPPIPLREIVSSSANMHFVPADPAVADQLGRVREGQVIRFRGLLIEASRADGWRWRSSLSREDSGGGACEIVWLEQLETG